MTTLKANRYMLIRGDEIIGEVEIRPEDGDFPWYGGRFTGTAAYEAVREDFEKELRLLNQDSMDEWGMTYDAIAAPGLKLISHSPHQEIENLLIHIDGEKTWFRC